MFEAHRTIVADSPDTVKQLDYGCCSERNTSPAPPADVTLANLVDASETERCDENAIDTTTVTEQFEHELGDTCDGSSSAMSCPRSRPSGSSAEVHG